MVTMQSWGMGRWMRVVWSWVLVFACAQAAATGPSPWVPLVVPPAVQAAVALSD